MGLALACLAGPALAQESPTGTWGNSVTWKNPFDRSVDLSVAESTKRSRSGGYGPGDVNTTYNGDVSSYTTNNGPVTSNSATNAVNLTTSTSTVTNGNGTVGVTFQTGSTSWNASQGATAQGASSTNGNASNGASGTVTGSSGN
ncbi:MAG: hypothetical protein KIH67_001725 [Candidatus Moranbacteria bacterium]|nr:hypothetical protein [Candidatus Moranbacteria bacterium]